MNALNTLEESWTLLVDDGEVLIFSRAIDWYLVRYNLTTPSSDQRTRKVVLEIRLCSRKGQPWWWVHRRREEEPTRSERKLSNSGDDIDMALKSVWDEHPDGDGNGELDHVTRRGMASSAIARPNGIEALLKRVDDAIRDFATKGVGPNVAAELREMQQNLLSPMHMRERSGARQQPPSRAPVQQTGTQYDQIVID
jgi:hypothetical protein